MEAIIAGAGIGGLTAALTLHRRGVDVTVLERAADLRPLGVGINLLPHAVRELDALGLGEAVAAIGAAPSVITYVDSTGRRLYDDPRGLAAGEEYPQLSVHRGRLQSVLLDAVAERLGPIETGCAVTGFTEEPNGVTAHTTRGDRHGDVLVGADGIGSTVRRLLHPGPDPLRWPGVQMYRGAARQAPFLDGETMAIVFGDNGIQLVTYPIGGGLVNWVLQVPTGAPGALPGDAEWNEPADRAAVGALVDGWRLGWLDVGQLIDHTAEVFSYPMVDRDPLPHWGTRRATLLGDAAHPMYPVGANGGSQAIVDARVLADELDADPAHGVTRYESRRRPDTAAVVHANRALHAAGPHDLAGVTHRYRTATERSHR
jgi:5-methylphenazine-1-carboxylate 1-monooxygenase